MVFYVRTRKGYDALVDLVGRTPSPVWVDRDVLTEQELHELRALGLDVTNLTVDPVGDPDIETIQLHHPDDIIWVQF